MQSDTQIKSTLLFKFNKILNQFGKESASDGYTLPYALLLTLVITIMLFGYISINYFSEIAALKQINKRKLDLACQSAIQLFLAYPERYIDRNHLSIDSTQVELKKYKNGLYDYYLIKANRNKDSSMAGYLVASSIPEFGKNALIVSKPNLRLTVAGETEIKGNILATSDKITKGNIFGIKNSSAPFLRGKIIVDGGLNSKAFPDSIINNFFKPENEASVKLFSDLIINKDFIDNIKQINFNKDYTTANFLVENNCQIKSNSDIAINLFTQNDVIIEKNIILSNMNLYSNGKISVKKDCRLQNVQLYSKEGIIIDNSVLNYPSTLGLFIETANTDTLNKLIEVKSSVINGSILLISDVVGLSNNDCRIIIDEDSFVQGFIYSENNLELLGELYGTAYTYSTYFYKDPTKYFNWLVNMKIDRDRLNQWFCYPISFSDATNYKIIKETWIY